MVMRNPAAIPIMMPRRSHHHAAMKLVKRISRSVMRGKSCPVFCIMSLSDGISTVLKTKMRTNSPLMTRTPLLTLIRM